MLRSAAVLALALGLAACDGPKPPKTSLDAARLAGVAPATDTCRLGSDGLLAVCRRAV
jgi:hypothetical protein